MNGTRDPSYAAADVDGVRADAGLARLRTWVERTFDLQPDARPVLPLGYFANVIRLHDLNLGVAITTDGVGSKLLIAELLGKYDTVGIDCIAMNVNDLLCVGATPLSFVDYVAVETMRPEVLDAVGRGLHRGAELARVNIAGGEIAQLKDMVRGAHPGGGLDLAGAAVGSVALDRVIVGEHVRPGDVLIGLASSGIHSNGLTLARHVLFQEAGLGVDSHVPELGRNLGEELLEPTRVYVPEITAMFTAGIDLKALIHVTGDGFLNLARTKAAVGYDIDTLPPPPPIFAVLQARGRLSDAEMYRVFNMGVGFCVVVAEPDVGRVLDIAAQHDVAAWRMGTTVASPQRTITLRPAGLVSADGRFVPRD